MPSPAPDPLNDPQAVFDTIATLANTRSPDWRGIAEVLKALG